VKDHLGADSQINQNLSLFFILKLVLHHPPVRLMKPSGAEDSSNHKTKK